MKTTLNTLAMIAFLPVMMMASHAYASQVMVRTSDRAPIIVELNGQHINTVPASSVTARNLPAGNHHLRILRQSVRGNRASYQILHDGNIRVHRGEDLDVTLDRGGRLVVQSRPVHQPGYGNNGGYGNTYGYGRDYGYGYEPDYTYARPRHGRANVHPVHGMNPGTFNHLRKALRSASFESTREQIARSAVSGNRISSRQLSQVLQEFSFESTRLRFAKWAYPYVTDRERIFMIYDSFSFDSSVRDFERYLARM